STLPKRTDNRLAARHPTLFFSPPSASEPVYNVGADRLGVGRFGGSASHGERPWRRSRQRLARCKPQRRRRSSGMTGLNCLAMTPRPSRKSLAPMVGRCGPYPHGDPATGPPGSSGIGRGREVTLVEFSREMGRRPFQPFTLVLVDGQRFTIDHPEFAATDRRG